MINKSSKPFKQGLTDGMLRGVNKCSYQWYQLFSYQNYNAGYIEGITVRKKENIHYTINLVG